jgi:hypothetical protein
LLDFHRVIRAVQRKIKDFVDCKAVRMVILKNYMLTEFNAWKEEMEYEYKPENDELLPYFETFNWTMAKMFLEHYLRRCMLRGQFDFMHWQSVQPKYPKDKFEALQKQFTLNKA